MASKIWTFPLEDGMHTVQIEQDAWTGRRSVTVDGALLESRVVLMSRADVPRFQINGHGCSLHFRGNSFSYNYELMIDGRTLGQGQDAAPQRLQPIPIWAWAFVVACAIIPVVALGGCLPILIGIGGAAGCVTLARDPKRALGMRLALCSGIVVLCWGAFIVLVASLTAAT
jgi:Fas apoptotic inhibitory molecule (FAIM1)